jgi:hypothetical protein
MFSNLAFFAERIAIYGGTSRAVIDRALKFGGCPDDFRANSERVYKEDAKQKRSSYREKNSVRQGGLATLPKGEQIYLPGCLQCGGRRCTFPSK